MAAPHRTHGRSHPKCRADRPPGNASCPHRESPPKRALDGEEDQLYTTGSAPRFTVNVVASTLWTVRGCCGNQQSITERPIQWRCNTLNEPCSLLLNRTTRTHTKKTRRDNFPKSAQITARCKQGTRARGHYTRHSGWKRKTISDGHGSDAPEEKQQPTCDKPLRVRPTRFQVNCRNGKPARPPQQTAAPTPCCSVQKTNSRN